MSYENCIAEIRAAGGGKLSDKDIEAVLDKVLSQAVRRSGVGAATVDSLRAAAAELAGTERMQAALERRNAALNLQATVARRERVTAAPDPIAGMTAEIHGINTPITGGRFSAEAEWHSLSRQYTAAPLGELDRAGLLKAAKSRPMEKLWSRELFELSKGADGHPGVTGSPEALKIAQTFHDAQTLAKANLNRAGASIGDYAGYIASTEHNPERIRTAGREAWKSAIRPLLDESTFDGLGGRASDPAAREQFLDRIYSGLVSGVHLTSDSIEGYRGSGSLANRVSGERVLHFRDADAWMKYRDQFGNRGSLASAVVRNLDRSARSTALMRRFGTSPRMGFDEDIRFHAARVRDSNPELAEKIMARGRPGGDLSNRFSYLDGSADLPVNKLGAKIGSGLRAIASMSKLGGMVAGDMAGMATHAAELRYQGVNLLEGYRNALVSMFRGQGRTAATREAMDLLLAHHEGMIHDIVRPFEPNDTLPGTMSSLQNLFFKLSGSEYVNSAQRSGSEYAMARHLGRNLDRDFGSLQPELQRVLDQFGIGPAEWGLLRSAADPHRVDNRAFLTPDLAHRLDHDAAVRYLTDKGLPATDAAISRLGDDLATRIVAYFDDRSRHTMIVPGIATKADLLRGTSPGTILGEVARMVAQFKGWPTAFVRMALGRELYGQSKPAAIAGLLHVFVASTVLGYGIMVLKALAAGRVPRDPADPATWLAAMTQGGGMGILGDYLFGEYNRFGMNAAETVLGPVIGQGANSILDIWNRAKQGKDVGSSIYRTVLQNMPFGNLVYTKLALDYLVNWQIQEILNPGAMKRFEASVYQNNRQRFWLSPSAAVGGSHAAHKPRAPHAAAPWSWAH